MRRHHFKPIGLYVAAAGLLILFAVILPAICWWILLGLALIYAGFLLMRC
ncbi:MAG: hypothetical protein FWC96_00120 [Oscillospiraceae bacterium]|nr:hypothetical protein [Oscillospiraceae bacterium]